MRKSLLKVFPVVVICVFLFVGVSAAAENLQDKDQKKDRTHVSIGYNQYYMWWDPVWSKLDMPTAFKIMSPYWKELTLYKGSNFVYNPVIALDFPGRWSLSGNFMYGEFSTKGSSYGYAPAGGPDYLTTRRKIKATKYDAEILIQYNINDWCKIYGGPKYQGYRMEDNHFVYNFTNSNSVPFIDNVRYHSVGAGIGTGFTVHLGKGVFLLPNVSGIFLYGRDFEKVNPFISIFFSKAHDSVLIGGIGDLSFAYYIKKIWTTITIGFKCQYLYYTQTPREEHRQKYDLIFGPHLGFVVTF